MHDFGDISAQLVYMPIFSQSLLSVGILAVTDWSLPCCNENVVVFVFLDKVAYAMKSGRHMGPSR